MPSTHIPTPLVRIMQAFRIRSRARVAIGPMCPKKRASSPQCSMDFVSPEADLPLQAGWRRGRGASRGACIRCPSRGARGALLSSKLMQGAWESGQRMEFQAGGEPRFCICAASQELLRLRLRHCPSPQLQPSRQQYRAFTVGIGFYASQTPHDRLYASCASRSPLLAMRLLIMCSYRIANSVSRHLYAR